ncbi:MAG: manganese efflux pump [Alistipes sp.]|nr:manganese efflux pump [Alistipes sp.]
MGVIEMILLGFGLAMDATAVSIGKGLSLKKVEPSHALKAGVWFGGFQALMPIIGYFLGVSFSGFVASVDHWICFGLLLLIGANMVREALSGDDDELDDNFSPRTMFLMAVATSIDALVVGVTLAFANANIWVAAAIIGVVTFALSFSGLYLGRVIGSKFGSKAGVLGGLVLIAIGIKTLIEHLSE